MLEHILTSVVKYCTFNDVDNGSDHLPLCSCFGIEMMRITPCESRQFKSNPKWYLVNYIMLSFYRKTLGAFLRQINCCEMLECDVTCKRHESDIQVIIAMQQATKLTMPSTKPHACKRKMGKV